MKPKRHVCTCLTPATHWCPKTGKQYCRQHAERYASVFGEESLKLFPADKPKPAIKESSELNDRIKRLEEALDRIIEIRNSADGVEQYVTLDSIESVATKAKEAKP